MLKISVLIVLIILVWRLNTKAQILTGIVVYKQTVYHDTIGMGENSTDATFYFDVKERNSIYVTDKKKSNLPSENVYEKNDQGVMMIKKTNPGTKNGKILYKSYKTKTLTYQDMVGGKRFIVKDAYPEINWQILDSTKYIKGLTCQKAEGDFRGRHYIAWFTDKIPIPDGPWKLGGLPGLILWAYDEKKQFIFEAQSIDFPKEITEIITVPSEGEEEIDFLSFYKLEEIEFKELPKKMAAKMTELGATVTNLKFTHNSIERNISY